MKKELRDKIISFNIARAKGDQARSDILALLTAMDPGWKKQLSRRPELQEIFARYEIEV